MELDHVAIVVKDLESGIKTFQYLGLKLIEKAEVKEEGVRIAFFSAGHSKVELIQPIADNSIKRFIEERGEGIHHMTFQVGSVKKEMERLKGRFQFTSSLPLLRHGRNVCFISPKSASGALIELVDEAY